MRFSCARTIDALARERAHGIITLRHLRICGVSENALYRQFINNSDRIPRLCKQHGQKTRGLHPQTTGRTASRTCYLARPLNRLRFIRNASTVVFTAVSVAAPRHPRSGASSGIPLHLYWWSDSSQQCLRGTQ